MPAKRVQVAESFEDVYKWALEQTCSDGLPIVPPTSDRVAAFLDTVDLKPESVIAELPPRRASCTVEQLAANAVMAGCLPDYFPVVVAALEALAVPAFELYGINTTTNPTAPMVIVNGPIRHELKINGSYSTLGPGFRANATIGRAVSLAMMNMAGRVPGEVCKSTHKFPGAYTMCVGEAEEKSPWAPLHVERGFKKEESTVTVWSPTGTTNMVDIDSMTADDLILGFRAAAIGAGSTNVFPFYGQGETGFMFSPPHADVLAQKFTKEQVKQYFVDNMKIPLDWLPKIRTDTMRARENGQIENGYVRFLARAEQVAIIVAGGPGGYHSVHLPMFGNSYIQTRLIRRKKK